MSDQSHQLNNCLSKIKIIYDMLKEDGADEELQQSLKNELEKIKEIFQFLRCNS